MARVARFLMRWMPLLLIGGMVGVAVAAPDEDPPGRVGRLAETIGGDVWLYTADGGEWIAAERNRPLTTGDRLSTDADARAEIQIGSTTVRLDGGTELEVLRIDDEQMRLQLRGGSLALRLERSDTAGEFRLVTEEGEFSFRRAGRYRFDRGEGTTEATVYSGETLFEGPFAAQTLYGGQRGEFWLDRGMAQYSIVEPRRDEFASWNEARDRRAERSAAARHVSPEMTGVEDLDRHGRWEASTEYGVLWIPTAVPVGWAPYTVGRWVWMSPWGWTWVDAAPWGFAPFHYGRWVYHRNMWGWAPGGYVARPVYAPALVAWIGGPNFSVTISSGHLGPAVGWFALAPHEVYMPGYHVSPRYVRYLNRGHVDHIDRIGDPSRFDYRNRRHHHAVTVVPRDVLREHRPVGDYRRQAPRGDGLIVAAPDIDRGRGFRAQRPRGDVPTAPPRRVSTTERRGFTPIERADRPRRGSDDGRRIGDRGPVYSTTPGPVPRMDAQPPRQWRDGDRLPGGRAFGDETRPRRTERGQAPMLVSPTTPAQPGGFAPEPRRDSGEPRRHHHGDGPALQRPAPMIRGSANPQPGMAPAIRGDARGEARGQGGSRRGPPDRATAR